MDDVLRSRRCCHGNTSSANFLNFIQSKVAVCKHAIDHAGQWIQEESNVDLGEMFNSFFDGENDRREQLSKSCLKRRKKMQTHIWRQVTTFSKQEKPCPAMWSMKIWITSLASSCLAMLKAFISLEIPYPCPSHLSNRLFSYVILSSYITNIKYRVWP